MRPLDGDAPAVFARPVFIVGCPRSGTSLLFETLAQAPGVWTIGGESHAAIEQIPNLHPSRRGWESNRLAAEDAGAATVRRLVGSFRTRLRNRDGERPPAGATGLRLLEKTPKSSLRVPFLAAAFPDARFLYLHRDAGKTVSSMLDAWRSGRFVTYPDLPGWAGPPWSLLLVPGWRELAGRELAEIAARQWQITTSRLLDDLAALPAERWCVSDYDRLIREPQAEVQRLCACLEIDWDRRLPVPLPPSRNLLTAPDPEKWRRNGRELERVLPSIAGAAQRARALLARAAAGGSPIAPSDIFPIR